MRLRSISAVVLCGSFLATVAFSSRAVAQIEFAKSTMRLTSAAEPATPSAPMSQSPPAETTVEQPLRPEAVTPTHVAPPARATKYFVQQTSFAEPVTAPPLAQPQMPSRAPSLVGVYRGASAQATLNKLPGPAPVQPKLPAIPKHAQGKPFQSVQSQPAISPYMNLYRNDTNANSLPNYFAYVRPQIQQMEANRQQAAELQKLRGQLQNMSSGGGGQQSGMATSAHYMDTGQFYRGMRR